MALFKKGKKEKEIKEEAVEVLALDTETETDETQEPALKPEAEKENEKKDAAKTKEIIKMKYRAYNEQNICERTGIIFATYFRTKKEAVAHAEKIGGNAKVERKIGDTWVAY